ncbi:GntR family transcriptional regulator [Serpentinicella alkaliphila]|uniref:GntR family transcriptional regulator n=1 Tax=Serpentinicella alkaliphila TaxID=1734049 RepID=A0A4R2TCM6_9FIRM|nr:GntR family transcriptional regulator [Serpentinicella alkaliphila]QUH26522.1 GntR family transcriptional regulator [Serpentinicella alkaliphila]TCP94848.1 GntR family transcriptional regulator [Serpentinicella alkaliphila]
MEFNNSKPIYLQIIDEVKKQLIRGELKIGDKIISQREYAQKMKVNPNTVQRAYREMEIMNLVETLRGQGTFICNRPEMLEEIKEEMAEKIMRSFLMEMKSIGYSDEKTINLIKQWQIKINEEGLK